MEWRFRACCCLPTAAPSTAIGVSRHSRCLESMTDLSMAAAPSADSEPLQPLAWACAAFAGGALLNLDRVPAWTAATTLLLIAWRLTTERSRARLPGRDRKSTRLNSSHGYISYAVFCLKKKKNSN